jgi:hypothetical protein
LHDALVQELLNLVNSRLGQDDVGNGLLTFVKSLRNDDRDSLRRDIRSRSDGNARSRKPQSESYRNSVSGSALDRATTTDHCGI